MNSNDKTQVIQPVPTPELPQPQTLREVGEQLTQVFAPVLANLGITPPPEQPRSRWRRFLDRVWDAATDAEWHSAARRCAGTALMWGFTVTSFLIFGKAALWVLFL